MFIFILFCIKLKMVFKCFEKHPRCLHALNSRQARFFSRRLSSNFEQICPRCCYVIRYSFRSVILKTAEPHVRHSFGGLAELSGIKRTLPVLSNSNEIRAMLSDRRTLSLKISQQATIN